MDGPHTDPATAPGRLEHHRIADPVRRPQRGVQIRQQPGAGRQRHPGRLRGGPRRVFRAEQLQLFRGRSDEDDAGVLAAPGESRVLGEEAVPGMDRAGTGVLGGPQDQIRVEIGLLRRRGTDPDRFVGEPYMGGRPVGIGEDRDGTQTRDGARCG